MNIEQVDHLLTLRESGRIDRRQLLGALFVVATGGRHPTGPFRPFKGRSACSDAEPCHTECRGPHAFARIL
jgi:hypothetical protein